VKSKTYEKDKLKDLEERVELIAESGYKTVAMEVIACKLCLLHKSTTFRLTMEGILKPQVVIVVDAPG
jgi:uracil-DNA glycosylase